MRPWRGEVDVAGRATRESRDNGKTRAPGPSTTKIGLTGALLSVIVKPGPSPPSGETDRYRERG